VQRGSEGGLDVSVADGVQHLEVGVPVEQLDEFGITGGEQVVLGLRRRGIRGRLADVKERPYLDGSALI
jgi:hypothetical protein